MKKLLVVLLAAMMVLSLAAVSMAAPTIGGDFRLNFVNDTTQTSQATIEDDYDFRLLINGKVSDNISAYGRLRTKSSSRSEFDEYKFTFNQSFGTITAGKWEWVITPSRKNLTSAGVYMMPKTESTVAIDVPFESGLYAGLAYVIDGEGAAFDGAYGLKVGYKTDAFGVQVAHLNYNSNDLAGQPDTTLGIDAWYQVIDSIKVYAYATDSELNGSDPDIDPIVGAQFSNIAGSKVTAWVEYAIDKDWKAAEGGAKRDENPYFVTVAIPITGGFSCEIEHNNYNNSVKDEDKTLVRAKFVF